MADYPCEARTLEDGLMVHVQQHYPGEWTAHADNYDGPESPMGCGNNEEEAIDDLLEKIADRQRKSFEQSSHLGG